MIAPEPAQNGQTKSSSTGSPAHGSGSARQRLLLRRVLDLFSSVWLGITLLTLLFLYSSIGSSGAPIGPGMLRPWFLLNPDAWVALREWRVLEMSEFEWFHWWPFDLLILLLCTNLIVTTVRRIPLKVINLGVWMIHTGIVVLCVGSVIYFSTKIEGDTPVIRRQVVVTVPGAAPVSLPAIPGAQEIVRGSAGDYSIMVAETDPGWEILADADKGKRAYSVKISVQGPAGQFTRQLLAGFPQYTEDIIRSQDPKQPFARAKKVLGRALVDESISMELLHDPERYNYLVGSAALYLREVGTAKWFQRPIRRAPNSLVDVARAVAAAVTPGATSPGPSLPRFNDHIGDTSLVWTAPGDSPPPLDPVDIAVPAAEPGDPLKDVAFHISGYLHYAETRSRRLPGGPALDPAAAVRLRNKAGRERDYELVALDPESSSVENGVMQMRWVTTPAEIDRIVEARAATLAIEVPGSGVPITANLDDPAAIGADVPFIPIAGTEFAYRVHGLRDHMLINNAAVSVAMIEIRAPDKTFSRWVFDPPNLTRDLPPGKDAPTHDIALPPDERIRTAYHPGNTPPAILLAAGPGDNDLNVVITTRDGQKRVPTKPGDAIEVADGTTFQVLSYYARTFNETRPLIVPREQRDRAADLGYSMIRVDLPTVESVRPAWLRYHHYAFETVNDNLRRNPYRPEQIRMPDGRAYEIMFSRQRIDLPAPVVLDDFKLVEQVGGFTGDTPSIRDWMSVVRFQSPEDSARWSERLHVSTNKPVEFDGFWFFQSQWDPPMQPRWEGDPPSSGLNYTVLGVGNRNGVHVQLAGCCIAVIGMIYSFYIKPEIKRRRQQKVLAELAAARASGDLLPPSRPRPARARNVVEPRP